MRIQTTIDALLNAFARRRREGHTSAMFAGAANTPGITIIATDQRQAHALADQNPGPTYVTLAQLDKLAGHRGPIAIDHYAIQAALAAANHEIDQTTRKANQLTDQLAAARDQIHNADLRADRAKRERDAAVSDLDALRADIRAMFAETPAERESLESEYTAALTKAFPEAEIEFSNGSDTYSIRVTDTGLDDPREIEDEIQGICESVFETGNFWT